MTTITSLPQPCECIRCGTTLSSPARCTYLDEETVSYTWVCHKCGCEFASSTSLYESPLTPEIVDEFLPNLVIG
jgi:transcription elongation factor Elf1